MIDIPTNTLPSADKFRDLSRKKQRHRLEESLGLFVDRLQVDGRDADPEQSQRFRSALEALGEGNYDQAYEDIVALQRISPPVSDDIAITGQLLSREEMASGLRHLLDRLEAKPVKELRNAQR